MKSTIFIFATLVSSVVFAETKVSAFFSGSASVSKYTTYRYRHSLDCYPTGKGAETVDHGVEQVSYSGNREATNSQSVTWSTSTTSPFRRLAVGITLDSKVVSTEKMESVDLNLKYANGPGVEQYYSSSCHHQDGTMVVADATIEGQIVVKYQVPENVWALAIQRKDPSGLLGLSNLSSQTGALNSTYNSGKWDGTILWVKPGQEITQTFNIPKGVLANRVLGKVTIEFQPIAAKITDESLLKLKTNLEKGTFLKNPNNATLEDLITTTLGMLRYSEVVQEFIKTQSISEIKMMSDYLFEIANSVFPKSFQKDSNSDIKLDGMAIKTAAAMASFQVAKALMVDLRGYCEDVTVHLPYSGTTQTVLGLHAATFWLSHSISMIRSYSYEPIETFIGQLVSIQNSGKTPADVMANAKLRSQLQSSYNLLINSSAIVGGPFNSSSVDIKRMLKVFPNIGAAAEAQSNIIDQLSQGSAKEKELVRAIMLSLKQYNAKNRKLIDFSALLMMVDDLKGRKIALEQTLTSSVRLLSVNNPEDRNDVMMQIFDLLNRQVNVFSNPVDVPYFETLRQEFNATQVKNLGFEIEKCIGLKVNHVN